MTNRGRSAMAQMYPTAAPRASRDPDRGLDERLRLHRGREPVGREAPRAQAVGERADGLARVGRRADPALGLRRAAVEDEHALAQRGGPGRPGHDDLEAAGACRPTRADSQWGPGPRPERDAA